MLPHTDRHIHCTLNEFFIYSLDQARTCWLTASLNPTSRCLQLLIFWDAFPTWTYGKTDGGWNSETTPRCDGPSDWWCGADETPMSPLGKTVENRGSPSCRSSGGLGDWGLIAHIRDRKVRGGTRGVRIPRLVNRSMFPGETEENTRAWLLLIVEVDLDST